MLRLNRILFARDFSPCSEHALPYALSLAGRTGAELHMLYAEVLHGDVFGQPERPAGAVDKLQEYLKAAEGRTSLTFDPASLRILHKVTRGIAAAPAILEYASDYDIDLIVMGTHGRRGMRHLLLGSVAEEVVRLAACPVLTIHDAFAGVDPQIRSILVPTDFSGHAREALHHAKVLADLFGARVDLIHVVDLRVHPIFYNAHVYSVYDVQPDFDETVRHHLSTFYRETDGPEGAVRFAVRTGHAAHEIVQYAEDEDIDLIVTATHGLTGLDRFLMGSVTEKVVRRARCPVFTVKSFGKSLVPAVAEADTAELPA